MSMLLPGPGLVLLLAARAYAAPTPEELALAQLLDRHSSAAVSRLATEQDAHQRWLAARVALDTGDLTTAARLLDGDAMPAVWGRIDLAARRGDASGAASAALTQMDRALAGTHRDALAELIVGWAKERAVEDPRSAADLLVAAIGLGPGRGTRHAAEDVLFRLPTSHRIGLVARRIAEEPASIGARLALAVGMAPARPATAASHLGALVHAADRADALLAARELVALDAPDPLVLDALHELATRFPDDKDVHALRLRHATTLAERDPARGTAELAALVGSPPRLDVLRAQAEATKGAAARRALWLRIAGIEGASAGGDAARANALTALVEAVRGEPAERRVEAARRALSEPDGAGVPELMHLAIPPGAGRVDALWSLAGRFPGGEWCEELAELLVDQGADPDVAARYRSTCPDTSTGAAAVLGETPTLYLSPRTGGVDVRVSQAKTLAVSQHRVDPEALFRATGGHPLDATLDAWLLDPDESWDVAVDGGLARRLALSPKGRAALVTLTVRAADQRATAFVLPDPLDVQLVHAGAELAVGVLRKGSPVAGVSLLVQDGAGKFVEARTGADGVAVVRGVEGEARVMARQGDGLGFATVGSAEQSTTTDTWALLPWQRTVVPTGEVIDVEVIGTAATGVAAKGGTLESYGLDGALLESIRVPAGVSHQRIFAVGGGELRLRDDTGATSSLALDAPGYGTPAVVAWWSPAEPRVGTSTTAHLAPLAGPSLTATWSIGDTTTTGLLDHALDVPIDLTTEMDARALPLSVRLRDGRRLSVPLVRRWSEGPRITGVPAIVSGTFTPGAPAGAWIRAESGSRRVWARAGEALDLDPGTWNLCAWQEGCGAPARVVVAEDTRWHGEPVLVAETTVGIARARWLKEGQAIEGASRPDAEVTWLSLARSGTPALAIPGPAPVDLRVSGELRRAATSQLRVGEGLPAGSRLWVRVQDATSVGALQVAAEVGAPWAGEAGTTTVDWSASEQWGTAIASGLLAEEQRRDEAQRVQRLDYDFSPAAEKAEYYEDGLGDIGTRGLGAGGSGYGQGGIASGKLSASEEPIHADPAPLLVAEGVAPGGLAISVPAWVATVDVSVVAQLPDGRWSSHAERLAVDGPTPTARPLAPAFEAPAIWDGSLQALLPVARSLPPMAAGHALAALEARGLAAAHAPLLALGPEGATSPLTRKLRALPPPDDSRTPDAIPDLHRARRAEAALALADQDPERARATALRLLGETGIDPYVRLRAGLAAWLTGDPGALPALAGDTPALSAARAIVSGKADPAALSGWWTLARNVGAAPIERAVAIHALSLATGRSVSPAPSELRTPTIEVTATPPLAAWHGQTFARGFYDGNAPALVAPAEVPAGRTVPLRVVVPASAVPERLACPNAWLDLAPSTSVRWMTCTVVAERSGPVTVALYEPGGLLVGAGSVEMKVGAARDSAVDDPMSQQEQLELGLARAPDGDADAVGLLERLMSTTALPPGELERASTAVLEGRRKLKDEPGLIQAFSAYREHVPGGALTLDTAAALATAYATRGDPTRALAASRVVMDARFKEELGAVNTIRAAGLELTALKLLRELIDRYPEVPTVVEARFLVPSMLLARAEGNGDRLGYTRSSLRHTAAAELAAFLLLHADATQAPEAAVQLSEALRSLEDPARERLLSGPLSARYRDTPEGWRLALADARTRLATGDAAAAEGILAKLTSSDGAEEIALMRGRVAEALGKLDAAREAYAQSSRPEAASRMAWLQRSEFDLPPTLFLSPEAPAVVPAELPPGTELTVTAIRINLESVLLRDGGELDAESIAVDGLRPAASRTLRVDATGDVPLPKLAEGAYLVTVSGAAQTQRMVLVRTDAELTLTAGYRGGALAHLTDHRGAALADAQLWVFDGSGETRTARTDRLGAAWLDRGGTVLARTGDRYALAGGAGFQSPANPAPVEWEEVSGYLQKNERAYDELFQQEARQKVKADAL